MGALTSMPLCQRARVEEDGNNNLPGMEDRNLAQGPQVVEIQPEATSTPKVDNRRRIEPIRPREGTERPELLVRAVCERTFGSDSGLEQSGDELEITREVEVHEEESIEYLNTALEDDDDEEDSEEEEEEVPEDTVETLESGDLGVNRATTFRVQKDESSVAMDLNDFEELSENLPKKEKEIQDLEEEEDTSSLVAKKFGVSEEDAITSMLSELTTGSPPTPVLRRYVGDGPESRNKLSSPVYSLW